MYSSFASYLIGFHMTIDGFQRGWDNDGWRVVHTLFKDKKKEGKDWSRHQVKDKEIPELVAAVSSFREEVRALMGLMKGDKAPLKRVRRKKSGRDVYGFGDASGSGFGATIQINGKIHYKYGQWCLEVTEKRSSNWWELNNLVEALIRMVVEHGL
jgi:hypothetical protein